MNGNSPIIFLYHLIIIWLELEFFFTYVPLFKHSSNHWIFLFFDFFVKELI
jgi:hypothetical protein